MSKNKALRIVNPLLGLLLVSQVTTGTLGWSVLGELFDMLHRTTGYLLLAVAMTHLALNWSWVKSNYFKSAKKKD